MQPSSLFEQQYEWVKNSRNVLFEFCKTVKPEDFVNQNSSFGRGGSMRNLLVHIANVYELWIGKYGLQKSITFSEYDTCKTIADVVRLFNAIDDYMYAFISLLDNTEMEIAYEVNGVKTTGSSLKIFTHVITHEFHHKGQILSISRHLGYIPVDTDIIR